MSAAHTKGVLRVGRQGRCVVGDEPVPEINGSDEVKFYGGHLIGESMTPENARRLVACWNSCDGIQTELLEEIPGIAGATVPYRVLRAEHATLQTDRDLLLLERDMLRAALTKALSGMERSEDHIPIAEWNAILNEGRAALGEAVVPPAPALPTEAAAIGAVLDSASLEQGEPA